MRIFEKIITKTKSHNIGIPEYFTESTVFSLRNMLHISRHILYLEEFKGRSLSHSSLMGFLREPSWLKMKRKEERRFFFFYWGYQIVKAMDCAHMPEILTKDEDDIAANPFCTGQVRHSLLCISYCIHRPLGFREQQGIIPVVRRLTN